MLSAVRLSMRRATRVNCIFAVGGAEVGIVGWLFDEVLLRGK